MNGNPENKNKSYKIYLIAFFVILALPLLAAPPWFHPAAWGKAIIFRIIISILVFLFIWQIISKKTKINFKDLLDRKNKVFWPFWLLIALWGIFLLATIFSLDPYYSFWESPYRAGGFLNFSCYIIFAVLAFLIIKERSWQKIWDFSIFFGVLVSIIAIFQQYNIFSETIIPYSGRPPSTMGGPTFLALYLILLFFITFSFALKEKQIKKKVFYILAFLLFILIILLTGSRAAYFGLLIGFFYFILCFPKKQRLVVSLKILFLLLLIVGAYGVYYLNGQPKLPNYLQKSKIFQGFSNRLSISMVLQEPRFSAWLVSLEAIKERPLFGYGPENFSIAFDKHYNPSLPYITRDWGSWYDKAHNFLFDISVTTGIPALIIFLSLFAVLFWRLQKVKEKEPENSLICHGVQATFFGYLAANFFSFDSFSTYLISFLLIAYSLSLIQKNNKLTETRVSVNGLWRSGVIFVLFCILVAFIWFAGLKPLSINKEINWALYYLRNGQCEKAIERMDNILSSRSNIDSYVRLQYLDIIKNCLEENINRKFVLVPKAVSVLKEAVKIRPYYTRIWLFLGAYLNVLIGNKDVFKIENVEELKKESYSCFEKALQLSPKREEIFLGWIETKLLFKEYQSAKEKSEECINLIPNSASCWWKKALANIYLGETEQAKEDIKTAAQKGYDIESKKSYSQLVSAYAQLAEATKKIEHFKPLVDIYQKLISFEPDNFQYHASLAYVYKILGEYDKAKKEAMIVLKLSPESKPNIDEFLRTLPR